MLRAPEIFNYKVITTMATGNTSCTTRERLEILKKSNKIVAKVLEDITTTLAKMRMTMNKISQDTKENKMTINAMRKESNENIERLKRRTVEGESARKRTHEEELHFTASKGKEKLEDGHETSAPETKKLLGRIGREEVVGLKAKGS